MAVCAPARPARDAVKSFPRYTATVKIICAPDSFKGSLSAAAAADAMAAGIRRALPNADIDLCPIADGGEGTLEAFAGAVSVDVVPVSVRGPSGEPVDGAIGLSEGGRTAIVESAVAAGLQIVPPDLRDPGSTSSYGVGELISAAIDHSPDRILIGVGGTATNDGGCGMAQALGVRFFDSDGALIAEPLTGGKLGEVSRIDASTRRTGLDRMELVVAADVQNPLTGPEGASAIYGPQKGATDEQVARLDAGLANVASLIRRDLALDIEQVPGAGSGGGLGGGLIAFAGASIASGIDTVLGAVAFDRRVRECDLCLTGEGESMRNRSPARPAWA